MWKVDPTKKVKWTFLHRFADKWLSRRPSARVSLFTLCWVRQSTCPVDKPHTTVFSRKWATCPSPRSHISLLFAFRPSKVCQSKVPVNYKISQSQPPEHAAPATTSTSRKEFAGWLQALAERVAAGEQPTCCRSELICSCSYSEGWRGGTAGTPRRPSRPRRLLPGHWGGGARSNLYTTRHLRITLGSYFSFFLFIFPPFQCVPQAVMRLSWLFLWLMGEAAKIPGFIGQTAAKDTVLTKGIRSWLKYALVVRTDAAIVLYNICFCTRTLSTNAMRFCTFRMGEKIA